MNSGKIILNGRRVNLREGDHIDKVLRKLKKKVRDSGILQDLRKKEFYEKPSVTRKHKLALAKNRWQKHVQQNQLPNKGNH